MTGANLRSGPPVTALSRKTTEREIVQYHPTGWLMFAISAKLHFERDRIADRLASLAY